MIGERRRDRIEGRRGQTGEKGDEGRGRTEFTAGRLDKWQNIGHSSRWVGIEANMAAAH